MSFNVFVWYVRYTKGPIIAMVSTNISNFVFPFYEVRAYFIINYMYFKRMFREHNLKKKKFSDTVYRVNTKVLFF